MERLRRQPRAGEETRGGGAISKPGPGGGGAISVPGAGEGEGGIVFGAYLKFSCVCGTS